MTRSAWRAMFLTGLLAGLLAGLVAGVWHFLATEPVIQRAIEIETARRAASGTLPGDEVVSRPVQRLGLLFGFALYGVAWGVLFGLVAWFLLQDTTRQLVPMQAFGLALAGCWTAGLFPLLKYPANPPGVGAAETVAYRQGLYVGFLALSILGALLAAAVYHGPRRWGGIWQQWRFRGTVAGLFYVVYAVILGVGMSNNPDAVPLLPALVATFRWLSLAGVTIFWVTLGSLFIFFTARQSISHDL